MPGGLDARTDVRARRRPRRSCRRRSRSVAISWIVPGGVGPRARAGWLEHAAVRLEHQDVVGQLVAIALPVVGAAAQAVFLVGEQDDADGAPGSEPSFFMRRSASQLTTHPAIVRGAGPHVPGSEVAAHDDDLVGQLASADLSDQVEGVGVGKEPGLHPQPQAHRVPRLCIR